MAQFPEEQSRSGEFKRQEDAFRDLTVRQTFGGELSDLELLRGKAIAEIRRTSPNLLSGGAQLVVQALERSGWNQTRAAALLGLNRDQIRYRIEKFKLERSSAH